MNRQRLRNTFERLDQIEDEVFISADRRQKQIINQLQNRRLVRQEQQKREQAIKHRSQPEMAKHPANNHIWIELFGFVDNHTHPDLSQIESRARQRRQIRQQMKQKDQIRKKLQNPNSEEIQSYEFQAKAVPRRKGLKKDQNVPWKLMRELRRKEVAENRARLERIQENKRQKMRDYHI